jgi:hypothetical protein
MRRPRSVISDGRPTWTPWPSTTPSTPRPSRLLKDSTEGELLGHARRHGGAVGNQTQLAVGHGQTRHGARLVAGVVALGHRRRAAVVAVGRGLGRRLGIDDAAGEHRDPEDHRKGGGERRDARRGVHQATTLSTLTRWTPATSETPSVTDSTQCSHVMPSTRYSWTSGEEARGMGFWSSYRGGVSMIPARGIPV